MIVLWLLLSVVAAYLVTCLSIALSWRWGIVNLPNPRSLHTGIVPRLGGLGILSGFYFPLAAAIVLDSLNGGDKSVSFHDFLGAVFIGGGMAALGFYDDLRNPSAALKLLSQLVLVALAIVWGLRLELISFPFLPPVTLGVLSIPFTLCWVAGFANISNFMDGIDGMAAGTGAVYGTLVFLLASGEGAHSEAFLALLLTGSCLGFLPHNFPRAHTFMGDSGSLFLGVLLAWLAARVAQISLRPETFIAVVIAFSVSLYDTGFTLLRRLMRRESIFHAHRSYLYQRLVQAGLTHARVTGLYIGLHVLVAGLAMFYIRVAEVGRLVVLIITGLLLGLFTLVVNRIERRAANP